MPRADCKLNIWVKRFDNIAAGVERKNAVYMPGPTMKMAGSGSGNGIVNGRSCISTEVSVL